MPRKPLKQRKKENADPARRDEISPKPKAEQSVQELEKASREAAENGLPAPQKQI